MKWHRQNLKAMILSGGNCFYFLTKSETNSKRIVVLQLGCLFHLEEKIDTFVYSTREKDMSGFHIVGFMINVYRLYALFVGGLALGKTT